MDHRRKFVALFLLIMACDGGRLRVTNNASADSLRDDVPPGANPRLVASVGVEVEVKNTLEPHEGATFVADGWTLVQVNDPPDARLVAFDPALLASHASAIRVQLASTSPREADTDNLVAIVEAASAPDIRLPAINALGRIAGPRGQGALLRLLTSSALRGDVAARHSVAPLLRPRDLDDPNAAQMAALLDNAQLDETDKTQLAFTLVLIGVRDGMELPLNVRRQLSASALARLQAAKQLIVGGVQ